MSNTTAIAFRRLGLIPAGDTPVSTTEDVAAIAAVVAELAHLGVRVANPDALTAQAIGYWPDLYQAIIDLRAGKISGRASAPLFEGFPDRLPLWDHAGLRFGIAAMRLLSRVTVGDDAGPGPVTDDDIRAAMDMTGYAWWPASSVPQQPADIVAARSFYQSTLPGDSRVEWITVTAVADINQALRDWTATVAASAASVRAEVRADFRYLVDLFGIDAIDPATVRFAELRAEITRYLLIHDPAAIAKLDLTPTDLLRGIAAYTDGDVSLAAPLVVPDLTRVQRRAILDALERTPRRRDVWRHRGLWLTIARGVHPGDYRRLFPETAQLFADLAATRRDHLTPASRFERSATGPTSTAAAAERLAAVAPTLLLRNLRRITRNIGTPAGYLVDGVDQFPLRTLLSVRAAVADNAATYPRLVVPKSGPPIVLDAPAVGPLDPALTDDLIEAVDAAIERTVRARFDSWAGESVWIDPALGSLLVPDQARTTTDGVLNIDRGSRIPVGDAAVIRLFTHWMQGDDDRSDLDLSAVMYDDDLRNAGHVSWTRLAAGTVAVHSGDITSAPAPHGATEYIDIDIAKVPARYVAPAVYRYSGPSFRDLPVAVAGWMLRDDFDRSRAAFDAKTVANAFRLNSGSTAVPFLFDTLNREIIYVDTFTGSKFGAAVENHAGLPSLLRATMNRGKVRPTIADLANVHARVRGAAATDDRDTATITFGTDDTCTYNAHRPQTILTDLL